MQEKASDGLRAILRGVEDAEREEEKAKQSQAITISISLDVKTIELVDRCFRRVICFLEWHHDQVSLGPGAIRAKRSSELVS